MQKKYPKQGIFNLSNGITFDQVINRLFYNLFFQRNTVGIIPVIIFLHTIYFNPIRMRVDIAPIGFQKSY